MLKQRLHALGMTGTWIPTSYILVTNRDAMLQTVVGWPTFDHERMPVVTMMLFHIFELLLQGHLTYSILRMLHVA